MKKLWNFAVNTFLVVTKGSFVLAYKINEFHYNALEAVKSDAFFLSLFTPFKVLRDAYQAAYTSWQTSMGIHEGKTLAVTNLYEDLSSNQIRAWDVAIQNVYDQTSAKYKSILPDNRKPFQNGSQDDRLQALKNLSTAIGSDAALASVKAKVDAFIASLTTALDDQKNALINTTNFSNTLETQRIASCKGLYKDLGMLMAHFVENPESICDYFPLSLIRQSAQASFTGHVKPAAIKYIVKRTLAATDTLTIHNLGTKPLTFFFGANKKAKPGTVAFTIQGGDVQNVTADLLGDVSLKFILVSNTDPDVEGQYRFDID